MGNRRHKSRDDLAGEHKIGDMGQAVIAIAFFIVYFSDIFIFKYTTFLNDSISLWIRIPIGIILLIISGYLAKTGMGIVFGEKRDTPQVIRKGVFSVMRHPVYFSEILLYLGLLIMGISLSAAVIWVVAIIFLYFISRHEEKLLLSQFGKEYETYMKEVPMFIPKFGFRKNK
jgi:protein-S-isoprenylcysteine O-methyltransferase Ste14